MSESSNLPAPIAEKSNPLTPKHWQIAWNEFGRSHPYMKHGAVLVNWILFNGLGGSVLLGISLIRGWLPITAWIITFLSITVLTQIFMAHYAGLAYERRLSYLETPHLEILFDENDGRFVYPFNLEVEGAIQDAVMFKVGIISTTADLVSLAIPNIILGESTATNVYLHITDDRTYEKRETRLNAYDDPVFWDVMVAAPRYSKLRSDGERFYLQHIKPNTTKEIPVGKEVQFPITASGRNGKQPTRKIVKFGLNEEYKPHFELLNPADSQ